MNETLVEIVTTVGRREDAERLARELVESHAAACVSFHPVRSVYRWEGELREEEEVQVVCKTLARRAEFAEERLIALHPYETPQVLRLPVLGASGDYAAWVAESVSSGEDPRA